MKKVRGAMVFVIIFVVMAISILTMHYFNSYNLRKLPPSEEWSKEVLVSKGVQNEATKPYPRIIKVNNNHIIAHQNGASVKLIKTDNLGNRLVEKSFDQKDDLIKYINLLSDDEYIYLNVVKFDASDRVMICYKLDNNLDEVENWEIDNVDSTAQIGSNILITAYEDKIEVYDIKSNTKLYKDVKNATFITGTRVNDKYMVSYQEGNKYFKYFYVNPDWTVSETKLAGIMAPDKKGYFERANLACDDEYGYIFVDVKSGSDRYGTIRYLQFSFDGKVQNVKEFRQDPFRELYSPIAVSSGNRARFIAGSSRQYGKKEEQFNLVEFYFEDGKMKDYTMASRTKEASVYPAIFEDSIIFMGSTGTDYNIYMASMNEEFKSANNYTRPYESQRAFSDVISGFMFSISYTIIYGIRWIILGLVCIAAMSYFAYNMKDKNKLRAFTLIYLITTIAKLYSIYDYFYVKFSYMLPEAFVSPVFGLILCFVISITCWLFGINRYSKNLESIPFGSFCYALLIDSLLTQMVFIPFIA
jgi:hypothetical protein